MHILGIDFGKSKIGLAIGNSKIAEPWMVIKYSDSKILIEKIKKIIESEKFDKVVVGISENEMAKETRKFGQELKFITDVEVVYHDETLSSQDAISLSIQSGVKRKKRKRMEDAYAASIMLSNYIDSFLR